MPKPATKCETCGNGFEQRKGGRPARFCSDPCRNRAHRKQTKPAPRVAKPAQQRTLTGQMAQLDYLQMLRDSLITALQDCPPDKVGGIARELRATLKEIDALTPEKEEEPRAPTRGGRILRAFNPAAI